MGVAAGIGVSVAASIVDLEIENDVATFVDGNSSIYSSGSITLNSLFNYTFDIYVAGIVNLGICPESSMVW